MRTHPSSPSLHFSPIARGLHRYTHGVSSCIFHRCTVPGVGSLLTKTEIVGTVGSRVSGEFQTSRLPVYSSPPLSLSLCLSGLVLMSKVTRLRKKVTHWEIYKNLQERERARSMGNRRSAYAIAHRPANPTRRLGQTPCVCTRSSIRASVFTEEPASSTSGQRRYCDCWLTLVCNASPPPTPIWVPGRYSTIEPPDLCPALSCHG